MIISAYSSVMRIFFFSANIRVNGNIMALYVDCLLMLRINKSIFIRRTLTRFTHTKIHKKSNKMFSQQKLHNNDNKD